MITAEPQREGSSDSELIRRCCAGDHQAWRALYERYFHLVHRFVCALGVPAPEREDAIQDVFIAIYRSLPAFRGEARFSTWVYAIAARQAGRMGRRRRALFFVSRSLAEEERTRPRFVPAPALDDIDFAARLLARLSEKKRLVFVLFEIEGLSVEEIAEIVGRPVNTVWSRLHHARAELTRLAALAERGQLRAAQARGVARAAGDER